MNSILLDNYYLFNLAFTVAYTMLLLVYLGRHTHDNPEIRTLRRWLAVAVAWAFFDVTVAYAARAFSPQAGFQVVRYLSILFVFAPGMGAEMVLVLVRPVTWPIRSLLYSPALVFYLGWLVDPTLLSAIPMVNQQGYVADLGPMFLAFAFYATAMPGAMTWLLYRSALKENDPMVKNEKRLLALGSLLTTGGIAMAQPVAIVFGWPNLGSLCCSAFSLCAYLAIKRHGRVLSPLALLVAADLATPSGALQVKAGRIIWANQGLLNMLGTSKDNSPVGLELGEILSGSQEPDRAGEQLSDLLAGQEVTGQPVSLRVADGGEVRGTISSSWLKPEDPSQGLVMVFHDLTPMMRIQRELAQSEERMRAVFNAATVGIVLVNSEGKYEQVNQAWADMLGYGTDELVGINIGTLTHSDDKEKTRKEFQAITKGKKDFYRIEQRYIRKDGSELWADISVSPLHNHQGEVVAILGVFLDITARREAEEENIQREKLQAAIETAGAACHELNQPLQSLFSRAELLLARSEPDDPHRAGLEKLLEEAGRIVEITRRLSKITWYRTTDYVGDAKILDLKKSSEK